MALDTYGDGAAFNMALQTLMRIDQLMQECNMFSKDRKYSEWRMSLQVWSREVLSVRSKNEKKDKQEFDDIQKISNDVSVLINNYMSDRKSPKTQPKDVTELYNKMSEWDFMLRIIMARKRLLMADSKDARFAIGDIG